MATIVFYEKPGCGTNARQKRALEAAGHTIIAKDLLHEPWTADRLRGFFGSVPVAAWFNAAAPRVKSGEIDPNSLTAAAALALMLSEPLLIRRPLIEAEGQRSAGFEGEVVSFLLGTCSNGDGQPNPNLLGCGRSVSSTPCPTPDDARTPR